MFRTAALIAFALLAVVYGQQVGTNQAENHPSLPVQKCVGINGTGTCTSEKTSIVLDSNWRWTHTTTGFTNCYNGNAWDATLCPDPDTCASNCAIDGADYTGTYGITAANNGVTLKFVTHGPDSTNIGSRVYLMASDTKYQMFKLKNQEFTFDVDMSNLPCGLNGALYFVEMSEDGGLSQYPGNKAGAKYGTGYCDSQCPQDIKFINGAANVLDWTGSSNDANSGTGRFGTCCTEMDIWEANGMASAYTPHVCTVTGQTQCEGVDCGAGDDRGNGVCDKDGCDFNSYRMGDTSFLGVGKTVDTKSVITVVTQFITNDGTASGQLSEIRRVYVQNGKVIQNSSTKIPGMDTFDSITDDFCNAQKTTFGDTNTFEDRGGLKAMGDAMNRGMVLVMSLWDDHAVNMLWLDSNYPTDKAASAPGVARGACATTSGVPADVESQSPNASVTYSNIRYGDIGSTFGSGSTTTPPPSNPGGGSTGGTAVHFAQCGGTGYTGPTVCESPYTCQVNNEFYSQCL